jgi:hypothetical protein
MKTTLASVLGIFLAACSGSSSASTQLRSPSPDPLTQNYVALVRSYWVQEMAADEVSNGFNLAAKVCLGVIARNRPNDVQLVDPPMCRDRAVAILANQKKFLSDLDTTPAPPKFAADDRVFRTQIPKAIADLEALIAVAETGSKDAVLQAASLYSDDMNPTVTGALDDVDPSVVHT